MHRLGSILGILGGAFWFSLPFYPPACVPVTESSEIFCNRLWSPALAGMLIGSVVFCFLLRNNVSRGTRAGFGLIVVAFGLMTVGNVGEYWFAYQLPHQGGPGAIVRSVLWMSVLAGWLISLIGAVVAGSALLRSRSRDRWVGWLLLLPLPLTFGFAAIGGPSLAPMSIGLLGILLGAYGLREGAYRSRVPSPGGVET